MNMFRIFIVLWALPLCAAEVTWTLPAGGHEMSDGSALDGNFLFELGAFVPGFVPTAGNIATWSTQWTPISRRGYVPGVVTSETVTIKENAGAILTTNQAYLWGFNIDQPTREWVLLTEAAWVWPDASTDAITTWTVNETTAQAIFGGLTSIAVTAAAGLSSDPVTTPQEWRAQVFPSPFLLNNPSISGWDADPDADGMTNIVEMALNTHPLNVNKRHEGLPSGTAISAVGEVFTSLTFQKLPDRHLDYTIVWSDDQRTWSTTQVTMIEADLNQISGRSNVPLTNFNPQFLRLDVSLPTP